MIKFEIKNKHSNKVMFTADIECNENTPNPIKMGLAVKWAIKNNQTLREADLTGVDLRWDDLTGVDLREANLTEADLTGANLTRADLSRANLTRANLTGANLTKALLRGAYLREANLTRANLTGVELIKANLNGANLTDADLTRADLTRVELIKADLTRANLTEAELTRSNLAEAYLIESKLTEAIFREKDLRTFKHDFWGVLLSYQNEIPDLIQYIKDGKIDGSVYSGECSCLMGSIANIANKSIEDPQFMMKNPKSPIERWFMMIKQGHNPENSFASKMALQWAQEFQNMLNHN